MPNSFLSIDNKLLAMTPFGYAVHTRMRRPRNLINNLATSWLPGMLLIWQLGGYGPLESVWRFAISYLAFIAFYEIGYFVNDTWGVRGDETPRRRLKVPFSRLDSVLFVAIRLAVWLGLAIWQGWVLQPMWIGFFTTFAVVITLHNTLNASAWKFASFLQMSLLRFSAPVLVWIGAERLPDLLMAGLLFFSFVRLITYMEAKGRLTIPERGERSYLLRIHTLLLPLSTLLTLALGTAAYVLLSVYFIVIQGLFMLVGTSGDRGSET